MNLGESKPDPSFWREVMRVYRFPIVMFALAIIPGLNFTYSGQGGISWFVIPLCFPWVILQALIRMTKGSEASGKWFKGFFHEDYFYVISPSLCRFPGPTQHLFD